MAKLTKKDVFKCYANWITFSLGCQNMERMMAPGFVRMMGLVADKLYDDPEQKKALLARHAQFFNTEETFGAIVPGVALGMEEKRAEGEDIPDELIQSTKTALMGPFAGMGDSLIGGTLRPILLSIAMGLSASSGSLAGPIFYMASWLVIIIPLSWILFSRGYKLGISASDFLFANGRKDMIVRAANIVGLVIVGAISALVSLDFLGFGLPPLTPSWGELLNQAQTHREAWWLILFPSLAIFTVMFLTVMVGEGVRNAFDPKPFSKLQ